MLQMYMCACSYDTFHKQRKKKLGNYICKIGKDNGRHCCLLTKSPPPTLFSGNDYLPL